MEVSDGVGVGVGVSVGVGVGVGVSVGVGVGVSVGVGVGVGVRVANAGGVVGVVLDEQAETDARASIARAAQPRTVPGKRRRP